VKQRQMEAAASRLLHADVELLCEAGTNRTRLDSLLENLDTALPAFSEAISNTYFSHAEMERAT
jgi:hypothetical protein